MRAIHSGVANGCWPLRQIGFPVFNLELITYVIDRPMVRPHSKVGTLTPAILICSIGRLHRTKG